ncbi:MAG: DUF2809 domain-containing protein [Leptospiraceae bacterium]|nr:DUF2809 domain-containing protein [Leptospiraceae bacterium]
MLFFERLTLILITIAAGLASRIIPFQSLLLSKYAGDALYAILLYLIIGLLRPRDNLPARSLAALVLVAAIECFQLTGVPLQLVQSQYLILKLFGLGLGTRFSWYDMAAYLVGIIIITAYESWQSRRRAL